MYIGWYLNHSKAPNADWDDDLAGYVSVREIAAGEEILIDYDLFEEPHDKKEGFYRKPD
jgi:SET domain-containing protein